MNKNLLRLFRHPTAPTAPDGLQQHQREAIVDLLHYCRIADDKLVVVEEEVEAKVEAALNWHSDVPLVTYAADSLARAESVVHDPTQRAKFIESVADRLATTELKTRAITICLDMFMADGQFVPAEREVFREIKHAMGWPDGA